MQTPLLVRGQQVRLVVDLDERDVRRSDLLEHLPDCADATLAIGCRSIDHVQREVGLDDLFQRRAERRDQRMRQTTVSEPSSSLLSGKRTWRSSGSSVTKRASDAVASDFVNRLNRVVLPALVYPTSATVGTAAFFRRSRS